MGHGWECDGPSMAHVWAALGSQLGLWLWLQVPKDDASVN